MRTLPTTSKLLKKLALAALLAPCLCGGDDAPVWREPVMIRRGENELQLLTPEQTAELERKRRETEAVPPEKEVPPVWIGDCCYYADGSYYHQDGVYWLADLKTHYVYAEGCWHLANGGILTDTGVYFPPMAAPDGLLGLPWRLAAVMTSLAAGPPRNPGKPPAEPVREVTEARSSSDR